MVDTAFRNTVSSSTPFCEAEFVRKRKPLACDASKALPASENHPCTDQVLSTISMLAHLGPPFSRSKEQELHVLIYPIQELSRARVSSAATSRDLLSTPTSLWRVSTASDVIAVQKTNTAGYLYNMLPYGDRFPALGHAQSIASFRRAVSCLLRSAYIEDSKNRRLCRWAGDAFSPHKAAGCSNLEGTQFDGAQVYDAEGEETRYRRYQSQRWPNAKCLS
ncbi:hypothetical protein OH77DRAFT_1265914 [Trametes cingulata]|nr:hypothetical protein OH77DRAFT_1265914 [Trametes cingulata]